MRRVSRTCPGVISRQDRRAPLASRKPFVPSKCRLAFWLRFFQDVPRLSAEEVEMRKGFRIALATAAVAAGLAFAGVGGLRVLIEQGLTSPDPSGMTPAEQLAAVTSRVRQMVAEQTNPVG